MSFFEKFDKVYCINLKSREDRKENFKNEVQKYNLGKFDFFDAVDGSKIENNTRFTNGVIGLILTNIKIFEDAIKNDYKTIIVVEDDCIFTDEINNIDVYLNNLPEDWDMVYFGGNHQSFPTSVNDYFNKLHMTYTTHFIIFKNTIFQKIIDRITKMDIQLDVMYCDLQREYNVYCTNKLIATQLPSYSDIEGGHTSYLHCIR
jgi:hypothetical protein